MKRRAAALALIAVLACRTAPSPAPTPAAPSELATTLQKLGDEALDAGQPALARTRFERALAAAPGSAEAQIGVGRSLAALGEPERARSALEAGLAHMESASARVALAELALARGERDVAFAELEHAIADDPTRIDAHQALASLSGPAPPGASGDAPALAEAHPYDPRARLAAGENALAVGDLPGAREHLESVLTLSDLDRRAAERAVQLLGEHFPAWRVRRVVWVHAFADELLRADPAWRFQQRIAWLAVSQALDPLLRTRFLVADLGGFRSEGAGLDLAPIDAAARVQVGTLPRDGIVAFLTGQPVPRQSGVWKQGQAEFLGRELCVRLARGEVASRVLAHELIHLFGGVHVSPDVDSLMNPSGRSTLLDPWNQAILRALRDRRFGPGGIDANVFGVVPLQPVIAAYGAVLQANIALRNAGVAEALQASQGAPGAAAPEVRKAVALDEHLGDVASFLGDLLARDGRPAGAARLHETAAYLYGVDTPRGRREMARAR